jgi:hypothetical protein
MQDRRAAAAAAHRTMTRHLSFRSTDERLFSTKGSSGSLLRGVKAADVGGSQRHVSRRFWLLAAAGSKRCSGSVREEEGGAGGTAAGARSARLCPCLVVTTH